jgi:hypothetical protein
MPLLQGVSVAVGKCVEEISWRAKVRRNRGFESTGCYFNSLITGIQHEDEMDKAYQVHGIVVIHSYSRPHFDLPLEL